jgi:hypothetical protein
MRVTNLEDERRTVRGAADKDTGLVLISTVKLTKKIDTLDTPG